MCAQLLQQKGQMDLLYYGRLVELAYDVVLLRRRPQKGHVGSNPTSSAKLSCNSCTQRYTKRSHLWSAYENSTPSSQPRSEDHA